MKKIILFSLFFYIVTSSMFLHAQWAKTYGGNNADTSQSIQQTTDGGYIVAGYTRSFSSERPYFWVLKLSSTGDIEWQRIYGSIYSEAYSIHQTSDGGYIVAGRTYRIRDDWSDYDFWVLKLSPTGDIEWQRAYGGYFSEEAYSIQQTGDGGYIVAGRTYRIRDDWSDYDFWVLKLSPTGDIEWQRAYGGLDNERAYSIQQTSDGGYIVAGYTTSFGSPGSNFWVLKLSPIGDIQWQRAYGGLDNERAFSVQQTSDGGFIVAGYTTSFAIEWFDYDFWVLKLSPSGDIEWQRAYGGNDIDLAKSIHQTSDGGYIVAGSTMSFGIAGTSLWILKINSTGDIQWQRIYGGSGNDEAYSIQQTSDGWYIVAGSTASFGAEESDFLVLRLSTDGDIDPSCEITGSSNASVQITSVSPEDTNITPLDTSITPFDTDVTLQDTNATVYQLCPAQNYTLIISADEGGVTDPQPGNYTYAPSARVTVTAIPNNGYQFKDWSGDATVTDNPTTIMMDSDKSLTAKFEKIDEPCFIATAAYGSPMHPHVEILRDFKDKHLMSSKVGRKFIDLYYKYSPFVANTIVIHKPLKAVARTGLLRVIVFCYSMVHFGPIITGVILIFVFILPFFLVMFNRRKLRQVR